MELAYAFKVKDLAWNMNRIIISSTVKSVSLQLMHTGIIVRLRSLAILNMKMHRNVYLIMALPLAPSLAVIALLTITSRKARDNTNDRFGLAASAVWAILFVLRSLHLTTRTLFKVTTLLQIHTQKEKLIPK